MAPPPTVSERLRRRAAATPDVVALATDRSARLTYATWDRRANAVARGLAGRGVRPGDSLALVFDNARWLEYAVSYVGVQRAGAVAVPLAPRFPDLDLIRIIADCAPAGIVAPPDLGPAGPYWRADPGELEDGRSTAAVEEQPDAVAPAEVLYRSGAMTPPVADVLTHADVAAAMPTWAASADGAVFLHAFPLGTLPGQQALWLPLGEPSVTALVMAAFDPDRFAALVAKYGVRACGLTPALSGALEAASVAGGHDLPPLERHVVGIHRAGAAPLSAATAPVAPSQEGMVWHEQFVPASFNLSPLLRRLRGALDVGALEAALGEILRRHGALRSTFSIVDGRAVQRVGPADPFRLSVTDLTGRPEHQQQAELRTMVAGARSRPVDLVLGPLFSPTLVRLGPDDHVLVIRVHHSVYDDWSVGLFRRELSALYAAFLAGDPSPLPEPPLQFADFCRRQRQELDGPRGAAERSFWARELAGAPLSVQLPIDDPWRPQGSPLAGTQPMSLELPDELAAALRALARGQRATLFIVMLAAFAALVQRCTGQDDVLLSSLVANRNRTELEGLIGCFGKKLLVRLPLAGDPTFAELVARTRRALMGAIGHQDLAYEAVVQDTLGPDAAAHGLVPQVGLKFQAAVTAKERLALPGLTASGVSLEVAGERPHFLAGDGDHGDDRDAPAPWGSGLYLNTFLGISVSETEGGVELVTEGVFHPPAVARLLRHFRTLLSGVAASPGQRISELPVLDDDDRAQLAAWNDTGADPPPESTVHDAFAAQARRTPDRVAITGERSLTYAELDARAEQLAARLVQLGVGPETPVGLCLAGTVDVVVAVLGIWKAGGAYVALDPADKAGLGAALADVGVDVVVTDTVTAEEVSERHPKLRVVEPGGGRPPSPEPAPAGPPSVVAGPRHLACVFYGAGPGSGHGVEIEHRSVLSLGMALRATAHRGDTGLRVGLRPVPTDQGFLRQLVALLAGHVLVLVGDTPRSTVAGLGDGDLDVVECTPEELSDLLEAGLGDALRARSDTVASPVRPAVVMATAGAVTVERWRAWRRIEGADAYLVYGPPECSFGAAICPAADAPVRPTVGRPVPNAGAHVLDPHGRPVPVQVVGELHVTGTVLARGYGRFASGQLARFLPDGRIELLGPAADHVDLRGFRVEPARIEAVLGDCPGVADVAVVLQDDGEPAGPRLVAYVVPDSGGPSPAPTSGALRRFLWSRLPGYAWPADVIRVAVLPRRGDGSVDHHAVRRTPNRPDHDEADGATDSAEERFLTAAWADVSEVEAADPDQNYWQAFSFLDVLATTRQAGVPIAIRQVMRNRTLRTLAADLAVEGTDSPAPRP